MRLMLFNLITIHLLFLACTFGFVWSFYIEIKVKVFFWKCVKSASLYGPGAGFMNRLKPWVRLKSWDFVSNFGNILLSLWTQTQCISQTSSTWDLAQSQAQIWAHEGFETLTQPWIWLSLRLFMKPAPDH